MSRPIPKAFITPSILGTALLITAAVSMWLVPAWVAFNVLFKFSLSVWLKLPTLFTLFFISGMGLHNLGLVGHDGSHFNLHQDKTISFFIGIFFSALVPFHCDVGFAVSHQLHHRFANKKGDPDLEILRPIDRWWKRILLARRALSLPYFVSTWKIALGKRNSMQTDAFPIAFHTLRKLAILNVVLSSVTLGSYFFMMLLFPKLGLCVIGIPFIFAYILGGLRPFVEHSSTGTDRTQVARSWNHWLMEILFLGHGYHGLHHLHPNVPIYKLRALNKWYKLNGYCKEYQMIEEPKFFAFFKYASGKYKYGPP